MILDYFVPSDELETEIAQFDEDMPNPKRQRIDIPDTNVMVVDKPPIAYDAGLRRGIGHDQMVDEDGNVRPKARIAARGERHERLGRGQSKRYND